MSESGSDILNGRGLLETIRLADRALELEKELAELKLVTETTKYFRTWAVDVVNGSKELKRDLADQLSKATGRNVPKEDRGDWALQQVAANLVARIVHDICRSSASVKIVQDAYYDSVNARLHIKSLDSEYRVNFELRGADGRRGYW